MTEPARCGLRCHRVTDRGICVRCTDLTGADLLEMVELFVRLHTRLLPGSKIGDRITGSRERPLGVAVDVLSFIGAPGNPDQPARFNARDQVGPPPMLDTLTTWCRLVADERPVTTPAATITGTVTFLTRHHDWATQQPWADDYAEEIRRAAHHARMLCQLYPARPEVKAGVPCRNCDGLGLFVAPGSDWIECPTCGRLLSQAEYADWVTRLLREGEDRVSAQRDRADALVKAWILDVYRKDQRLSAYRVTSSHLSECPDVSISWYEAEDGEYGCDTGCPYLRLEATLSCPHGETTEYEYGEFGEMADIIAELIKSDEAPDSR